MTLIQRLDALKAQYARAKKHHRERNYLAREMSHIMVKLIKRELTQERRTGVLRGSSFGPYT